jgi:hypothetical protein
MWPGGLLKSPLAALDMGFSAFLHVSLVVTGIGYVELTERADHETSPMRAHEERCHRDNYHWRAGLPSTAH